MADEQTGAATSGDGLFTFNFDDNTFWVTRNQLELAGTVYERAPGNFRILLKPLSGEELAVMRKRHMRFKRGDFDVNTNALAVEHFCAIVQDWEGLGARGIGPLECTLENKRRVAKDNEGFANAVIQAAELRRVVLDEEHADELGNSERSGAGV